MGYVRLRLSPLCCMDIKPSNIAFFISIVCYMGLVQLPSKQDYWRGNQDFWPLHFPVQIISCAMFAYIWQNFHLVASTGQANNEIDIDEDDKEMLDIKVEVEEN